ncbi:hypothetical protein [Neotabrizicola sp. sgz301269]|uniref:hypothetical protein n=1 Tax=Neotabrizicola sp. sgz301269 TaxID=3276282 RepID=UPI0037705943
MIHSSFPAPAALVALPEGLTAFLIAQGPAMWHEFALGLDFRASGVTIDLLLAADRICARPECDRATAALILARAVSAGLHRGVVPPGFDAYAARDFTFGLAKALREGRYAAARFALPPQDDRRLALLAGSRGPLALPPPALGQAPHDPPYGFAGLRPHLRSALGRCAA